MKTFIVVRHGDYGRDLRLNESGRMQMQHIARELRPYLAGRSIRLLASTAPRALDSADALARWLELSGYERHDVLWSDNTHQQNNRKALALIHERSEGVDALILVTHLEYAADLPTLFGQEVLGVKFRDVELSKGECRLVFCEEKRAIVIS